MDDGSDSSLWQRLTKVFHSRNEISVENIIRHASEDGELDKEEGTMLLSVLTLDDLQVQGIMTPRTDMACAPHTASTRDLAATIIETGHSRIPIYKETRDYIIGIVHAKDLLKHVLDKQGQDIPVTRIMREPFFVPETKNVLDLLNEFRLRKAHLAIILDEYGGTAGLITIEDVIEEIVGDIEDEYDAPRGEAITRQPDGSYLIAGRIYLEDLAENLGVHLESEEVDTLGGYLSLIAGRVPKPGESFLLEGRAFTIKEADVKQIHSVLVSDAPGDSLPKTGNDVGANP